VRGHRLLTAAAILAPLIVAYGGDRIGDVPRAHAAKPKKPAKPEPKPEPEPKAEPAPEKKAEKPKLEIATCPPEDLAVLDAAAVVKFVEGRCRTLRVPEGAAPTEIGDDEMFVAVCTRREGGTREAIEPKSCELEASVTILLPDGAKTMKLGADGDLALALRTAKVARDASPSNGTSLTLVATAGDQSLHSPLIFRRASEAYGHGRVIWFPLPMLTTDFSSAANGYRLGITPIAVALGWKWFPSATSRGYVGASVFGAWNLLVPNDTQTLSNGTGVRINYKAVGGGLLLDGAGFFGVGVGVGHTFTTDARTDFRMWFYFGPRLLFGLNEL